MPLGCFLFFYISYQSIVAEKKDVAGKHLFALMDIFSGRLSNRDTLASDFHIRYMYCVCLVCVCVSDSSDNRQEIRGMSNEEQMKIEEGEIQRE